MATASYFLHGAEMLCKIFGSTREAVGQTWVLQVGFERDMDLPWSCLSIL